MECDKLSVKILEPYDLTMTQYKVLKFLLINPPETVRQVDIEEHFYIRNPTVTRVLQNLETKGLIERKINPEDNRSKIICLTEQAKSMEKLLYQLGNEIEETLTSNLTSKDKSDLLRLLKKILSRKENNL